MSQMFHNKIISIYVPILCLCLFVGLHTQALALPEMQYDEIVSLGTACQPAWQIKKNGIRAQAYPFDWMVSPFGGLISFIVNKGANFLEPGKFHAHGLISGTNTLHVIDSVYHLQLVHDFHGPDPLVSYPKVKETYDRRIERFFNLLESNKNVLFIRVVISKAQAKQLDQVLKRHYPKLSYTIVAISEDENAKTDWGLPRVRNFYLKQIKGDWAGDYAVWKAILQQFPIKPRT